MKTLPGDLHVALSDLHRELVAAIPDDGLIDHIESVTPLLEALRQFAAVSERYPPLRDWISGRAEMVSVLTDAGTAFGRAAQRVTSVCGAWLWTPDSERPATAMTRPNVARADVQNRTAPNGCEIPAVPVRSELMELLEVLDYEIEELEVADEKRVALETLRAEVETQAGLKNLNDNSTTCV